MSLSALRHAVAQSRHNSTRRLLHASSSLSMPRMVRNQPQRKEADAEDEMVTLDDLQTPVGNDDVTSAGHMVLRQQRQVLYYMRLIEHDMPNLVAYRRPFVPPPPTSPLIIRSISYGNEEHPADRKRVIVAPVSQLPLTDDDARARFKLLAGVRWSPEPPKDAGVAPHENDEWGYFKLSCENFPKAAMNLKWASDTLDRLIAQANVVRKKLDNIPYDARHLEAKLRKAKRGGHAKGRGYTRPTLKDFPKEWLPDTPVPTTPSTSQ
ncbi:mitochondrial ribosomal subunit protein-domain-containing protein [Cristinia sonorae]|uniref:Mitochondrial ribosomal subunit protein-domain-containing protein n=1 Tax=Cristinia sonorae TaxID=1940300 RepID=A0A8K0XRK6_9AGAR|nr:mitochondrial ribosomal subunit protein-domain-containing protein [Cristinia sonorae]